MITPHRMIESVENGELSKAEQKVYELAVNGLTRNEIANKLFKSTRTIKFHFENIFRKKGVNSHIKLIASHYQKN